MFRTGMFICVEPLVQVGDDQVKVAADNWTVISTNGHLNAHFEHTLYITDEGAEIITNYEK